MTEPSAELLKQMQLIDDVPGEPRDTDHLSKLITEAMELMQVADSYEESLKAAKQRLEQLKKQDIPDAMRAAGIVDAAGHGKTSHKTGARVHLRHDLNAYVLAADKPGLIEWMRRNGNEDLIREEIHYQTLKAFCKERVENGSALPPMVKTSPETSAVITIPKPKGD